MAKAAKVSSNDESDHDSASDSDDDDLTKDELITMLEDCTQYFKESIKECKGLLKDKKNLMQELDELRASYESLKVDYKKLQKSHSKLEEAHSSLVKKCENMPTNVEKAKTCNIGISYDIIDESFHKPIVVASTNPSYSISTSSSTTARYQAETGYLLGHHLLRRVL
jgi:FtsZ-binding cell division protein ZapB